jgi:hypothetical protein
MGSGVKISAANGITYLESGICLNRPLRRITVNGQIKAAAGTYC